MRSKGNFPSLVSYEIKCRKFSSRLDVRDWIGEVLTLVSRHKHCQRHNGPEGWVLLTKVTSSFTNLDQIPKFKISTKHKHFDKTLTSKSWPNNHIITSPSLSSKIPNFSFKISLEVQLQTFDQTLYSKSEQKSIFMTKLQLPNLVL